jgi:hypothetical protein
MLVVERLTQVADALIGHFFTKGCIASSTCVCCCGCTGLTGVMALFANATVFEVPIDTQVAYIGVELEWPVAACALGCGSCAGLAGMRAG